MPANTRARAMAVASKARAVKRLATPPPPAPALPPTPPPTVKARKRKPPPADGDTSPIIPPAKTRRRKEPAVEEIPRVLYPLGDAAPALLPPHLPFEIDTAVHHLKSIDPRFGRFWDQIPCKPFVPPLVAICPFKTLVTSIIGQQVSWMAARAINNRFRKMFGFEEESEGFPTPAAVARADIVSLKAVGLSTRKAEYGAFSLKVSLNPVISLAEHFVSGQVSTELLQNGTDEEITRSLIAIRGIGQVSNSLDDAEKQWTVDMFLMFSLRRPDVLPVGDLGVQKGLLRWALAAHSALPATKVKDGKAASARKAKYAGVKVEKDKTETILRTPPPQPLALPPTPITPNPAVLRDEETATATPDSILPNEVLEIPEGQLPVATPADLIQPLISNPAWSAQKAAPLQEGLTIELMRSRLAGKKAKGGVYLTPQEMEVLTDSWRPYRSLGVYWMWPAGEDF